MRQTNINKEFRVYQLHINDTWVSRNRTGCRLETLQNPCPSGCGITRFRMSDEYHAHVRSICRDSKNLFAGCFTPYNTI